MVAPLFALPILAPLVGELEDAVGEFGVGQGAGDLVIVAGVAADHVLLGEHIGEGEAHRAVDIKDCESFGGCCGCVCGGG